MSDEGFVSKCLVSHFRIFMNPLHICAAQPNRVSDTHVDLHQDMHTGDSQSILEALEISSEAPYRVRDQLQSRKERMERLKSLGKDGLRGLTRGEAVPA